MKKLRMFVTVVVAMLFVGCYEVNEEIVINENGSGSYMTRMDMSQLLEMIQSMGGAEELAKEGLDKAVDTTIMMASFIDSSKDATAEQKELLKDGKLQVQMNVKEKLMKMNMDVPFKNYDNLGKLLAGKGNSGMGIGEAFKSVFEKNDSGNESGEKPMQPESNPMDQFNGIFDVVAKNGTLSKIVNKDKVKALMAKPEMEQMKQMSSTGMEILYTTTIKLPRPVKQSDNPLIKLSDDKKTVTIKYNLLEMLETPEKFSYTIQY